MVKLIKKGFILVTTHKVNVNIWKKCGTPNQLKMFLMN